MKTGTQIIKEHPGLAYLLVNIEQPYVNGVTLETRGCLYAVSDETDLDRLYAAADFVEAAGVKTLIDDWPLYSGKEFFTDY